MGDLLDAAQSALERAIKKGAQEAAASVYRSRQVEVEWRDGKLEKLEEATTRGLSLRLYVDGRYSAVSTSDLRPDALDTFVQDAIALTRTLAKDPFRSLPDPALYAGQAKVELELEDRAQGDVSAVERRKIAEQIEAASRSVQGASAIISVTTGCGDARSEEVRLHSNGFSGSEVRTAFWTSSSVSVKDPDGRRPSESDWATSRHRAALPAHDLIGKRAAERTLSRVGAKKMPSSETTVVIDNRVGGNLVNRLLGPLAASALQQKRSVFEGKLDTQIGSKLLDLADDPLIPRALGSRLYDSEGIAAKRLPLFAEGVLRSYYVDDYYGRKLGMKPTTGSVSNLSWKLGAKSGEELISGVKDGMFITGFLGGNSNATTGDFSLGVQGFRISNGKLGEPIAEMNIAGNHLELWKKLVAVGNDPYPFSSSRTPTLVFEGVQLAGT